MTTQQMRYYRGPVVTHVRRAVEPVLPAHLRAVIDDEDVHNGLKRYLLGGRSTTTLDIHESMDFIEESCVLAALGGECVPEPPERLL